MQRRMRDAEAERILDRLARREIQHHRDFADAAFGGENLRMSGKPQPGGMQGGLA